MATAAACLLAVVGVDVDELDEDSAAKAITGAVLLDEIRRHLKSIDEKIPKFTK